MYCRWSDGVFLGVRDESGEVIIGTKEGVIKVRSIKRKASIEARWNKELIDSFKGTPWEPVPGKEGAEIKTSVCIPCEFNPTETEIGVRKEVIRRRFRITPKDVAQHLPTMDCEGCKAANRGAQAVNHSAQCRDRFQRIFTEAKDPRIQRETDRLIT